MSEYTEDRTTPRSNGVLGTPLEQNLLCEFITTEAWSALAAVPVGSVLWSVRAATAIQSQDCQNLADICRITEHSWMRRRNVGRKTIAEIKDALLLIVRNAKMTATTDPAGSAQDLRIKAAESTLSNPKVLPIALWVSIIEDIKALGLNELTIGEAADIVGERWPPRRHNDPLSIYLTEAPKHLIRIAGIGRKKARVLMRCIVKLWLCHQSNTGNHGASFDRDLKEVIAVFGSGDLILGLKRSFIICGLARREISVLNLRYGLSGNPPWTLEQCGGAMRITRERVRQIEELAKKRLTSRPQLRSAMRTTLATIQEKLQGQLTELTAGFIPAQKGIRRLYAALGPWKSLLVDLCFGDVTAWLNATIQATHYGWLMPPLTEDNIQQASRDLLAFCPSQACPLPASFLQTELGTSSEIVQVVAVSGVGCYWNGYFSLNRFGKRVKRGLWLHERTRLASQPIINLLAILEPNQQSAGATFPSVRSWWIDALELPDLFIPASQGRVLRLPAIWERESSPSVGVKLDDVINASEVETDPQDASAENEETMERFLVDLLKRKSVWRTGELQNAVASQTNGRFSPNSVVPIANDSRFLQRLAPGVWGPRATDPTELPYSSILTAEDCALYVQSKWAKADLSLFPLWNLEMEKRWCVWAAANAHERIYQSLLSIITPDCWQCSESFRKHWLDKKRKNGVFRFERRMTAPIARFSWSAGDLLLAAGATVARNGTCWIDLNALQGRRLDSEHASVFLAMLIGLGAVVPGESWQRWHAATVQANTVFNTLCQLWHSKAGGNHQAVLEHTVSALDMRQDGRWVESKELRALIEGNANATLAAGELQKVI